MRALLVILLVAQVTITTAQEISSSIIHAHNDYVTEVPFAVAYAKEAGAIEADVFLVNNVLYVAHTDKEISPEHTLEELYLKPLVQKIAIQKGVVYKQGKPLTLFIDLKTEGLATLKSLVTLLKKYPILTSTPSLTITISGDVPAPDQWDSFPAYIHFDGRPTISYSAKQLARITTISDNFANYSKWNGKWTVEPTDLKKITDVIGQAHALQKKFRFWGTPDGVNAWVTLQQLGVDYIGTDRVAELADLLKNPSKRIYTNQDIHSVAPATKSSTKTTTTKNIIFLVGDGMGLAQVYAGYTANQGKLNLFTIPTIGLSITVSSDSYITDSAAGATAFASGHKTKNRAIGVDSVGNNVTSITTILHAQQFKSAIISAGNITDATPACFYAHETDRSYQDAIALDFLESNTDILMGGGAKHFNQRADKLDVFEKLKEKGYAIESDVYTMDTKSPKHVVINDQYSKSIKDGRGDFLSTSLEKSLAILGQPGQRFFIMAEGAQIDHGGHANDVSYVVREMLDFDKAISIAKAYVDKHPETLLVITADHETGGLTLPEGNIAAGVVQANFSTGHHTGVPVLVFAYGAGAADFAGVYQNTAIFHKMLRATGIK